MSPSLFILGFFALLQVISCRSVYEQNEDQSQEMQSVLAKLLLQVQELPDELPDELQEEGLSEEILEQDDEAQEQDAGPSDAYLKELNKIFPGGEQQLSTIQTSDTTIQNGDAIALQTINRGNWMSFAGKRKKPPRTDTCPGLYMDEKDYEKCGTEVFQIYRAFGKGNVRSGDVVGLYQPQTKTWLGCSNKKKCSKAKCPGEPNLESDIAIDREHWYRCYAEVFAIYSRGKEDGAEVTHQDDIMLLYLNKYEYVSTYKGIMRRSGCPGTTRPPTEYEKCKREVFKIWKKGFTQ